MSIYLDHAATSPLRPEVMEAMEALLTSGLGNASSRHAFGRRAAGVLEDARERVARTLGAAPDEIVFVRGGTEGDNLAVLGRGLHALRHPGPLRPAALVSAIEHPAVLAAARALSTFGGGHTCLTVHASGRLDSDQLDAALAANPAVVSVQWVNNETGLLLPVSEVVERAAPAGVPVHTDAVQAAGKVAVRVDKVPVDLLTLTGHKLGGPMGVGALFVRRGVELEPLLYGGGHERGMRPGTSDVVGALGLAVALERSVEALPEQAVRWHGLRERLDAGVRELVADRVVHGGQGARAPHIHNVGLPRVDADALLAGLDLEGVAVSGGSACASGSGRGSHVLEALYGDAQDRAALRFSFGPDTDEDDIDGALAALTRVLARLGVGS
ncbi:MAG: cysteine desulfurase family protein [Gemmatimonadota bacterium]